MLTMSAVLRTPIGDLLLIACEQGLVAIEFTEVSDDKNLELSRVKLHDLTKVPSKPESQTDHEGSGNEENSWSPIVIDTSHHRTEQAHC